MPGKYLEYIKAGRYVVPVELSFLSVSYTDLMTGRDVTTTKWVERRHWKDIRAMLKPAVEHVAKYNESGSEKIHKSYNICLSPGQEMSFGYIIHLNKDKSPFLAVLDSKTNIWTDDEQEDEIDENTDLADYGGRHSTYTNTKYYVKACVVKKSGSVVEDGHRLRRELGVKTDDVKNYFRPTNSTVGPSEVPIPVPGNSAGVSNPDLCDPDPCGTPVISHHEKHKSSKTSLKKRDKTKNKDGHRHHRKRDRGAHGDMSGTESLIELPPPISHTWGINDGRNFGDYQSSNQATIIRSRMPDDLMSSSSFGIPGSFSYADKDEEDSDDSSDDAVQHVVEYGKEPTLEEAFKSSFFRNWDEEEETDGESLPELPDIEETNHVVARKRRRNKKAPGPRKKYASDRSPIKNINVNTGLPDIDDGHLGRGTKATKGKKKRSVAIVEPMKPMKSSSNAQVSFEEAIGAYGTPTIERRKKGRNNMSSPTVDRLPGSSRSKNSAIEIISGDSDLLLLPEAGKSAEKKKKKDGEKSPRKRRKKKPNASIYDRLTPSPFPESPEESDQNADPIVATDSEPEMPILVKMVSTSEEEQDKEDMSEDHQSIFPPLERVSNTDTNGLETLDQTEIIVLHEQEEAVNTTNLDASVDPQSILNNNRVEQNGTLQEIEHISPNKKRKKKLLKRRSKTNTEEGIVPSDSATVSSQANSEKSDTVDHPVLLRKTRYASDSDDITAESGYRKTPLKKKKRKKVVRLPDSVPDVPNNINTDRVECVEPDNSAEILSQRRSTGDAQTQTVLCETSPQPVATTQEKETEDSSNIIKSFTKMENPDENVSYDSDYAQGAFSEGDDDDVVFEGQFQANLHLPALGSPEEGRDESDLFSFENPVTVLDSTNSSLVLPDGPLEPPHPLLMPRPDVMDEPPIEDYEINYSFDLSAPSPSNIVTIDASGKNLSEVVRSFHHDVNCENPQNEVQVAPIATPGNMSIYQLINHPSTLQAGFGLFNQLASKRINVDEVHKRLGRKNDSKLISTMNENLMPPPSIKRPVSPDICSLNPEKRRRKIKFNKGSVKSVPGRNSPQPGPSNSGRFDVPNENSMNVGDSDEDEENGRGCGESLFRELMNRTQECEAAAAQYVPQGDEFDLSQRSHCMLGLVPQYAEKSRRYKMHAKKIKNITIAELTAHFEIIKSDIQGIFDGRIICFRSSLYCSKNQHDRALLRSINVNFPFEDVHGKALSTLLFNLLLPQPGSRLKYTEYINYVMLPEAFIRIYSRVNSVCYEMAEQEMRCGGVYDEPLEL